MKKKNIQTRLLYLARISFRYEGEIKSFTDKQKLREFSTTKSAPQQMLKDLLWTGNTKKVYKNEPKATKCGIILINNHLKCKWVKCFDQKTNTGQLDTKTKLLYMLCTRYPSQT